MSRFVRAAKHLKFSSESGPHASSTPEGDDHHYLSATDLERSRSATSDPEDEAEEDDEHIILLGGPKNSVAASAAATSIPATSPQRPQNTNPSAYNNSSSPDPAARRGSPSKARLASPRGSVALTTDMPPSKSTELPSATSEPALGEGSLKLEHLLPTVSAPSGTTAAPDASSASSSAGLSSHQHPRSPNLLPSAAATAGQQSQSTGDLPDIAVQMASPPEPQAFTTTPRPSNFRRTSGYSDVSDDDRKLTRPRSASNISASSAADRGTRSRSTSAVRRPAASPKRSGTTTSSAGSGGGGLPSISPPHTKQRSFTVGSRNSAGAASNGIAGALAMSGFTLGAPGSAGHPGMSFAPGHEPWVASPPPSLPSRSRAGSVIDEATTGGDAADDDEMRRVGSLDSQIGDFGYIDDVDLGSGYALAGIKRNQEFHQLFDNVPEHDALIEDYGCALWKDILTQGRLYISEHHLCFYANILGWVTNLVVPFSEVISIEKRMTAYVIPNAITVKTLHVHHTFASFLSRDTTYALIVDIWSKSHPNIPPGAALPDHGFEEESAVEEEVALADDQAAPPTKEKKSRLRMRRGGKASAAAPSVSEAQANAGATLGPPSPLATPPVKKATTTHRPTQVPASVPMFKDVCMDATFAGSPEKIYNLMFTSEGFMRDFWANNMKLTDIEIGEWKPSENKLLERTVSYVKPLNGPVGPKSMKCYITDANENVDFDDYISVLTTTRTPDAPSGNAFSTKTRSCFTWAANNCCRVQVTTTVEWTKGSLLKGVITSSALDGQKVYHTELVKVIKSYMQAHKSEFQHSSGGEDISDNVVDAVVDEEPLLNQSTEPTSTSSSNSMLQPIMPAVDFVKGAADFLLELAMSNSIATSIIFLLLFFNIWTLFSRGGEDVDAASGSRVRSPPGSHLRSGDEVAEAVTRVLQDYFAPARAHRDASDQITTVPVARQKRDFDPATELSEIYSALEDLETRVARLRSVLAEKEVQSEQRHKQR